MSFRGPWGGCGPRGAAGPLEGRACCSQEARSRPGILALSARFLPARSGPRSRDPAIPGQTPRSPRTMRPLLCALAGFSLLCGAAEPLSTSQGDPAWSTGCDRLEAVRGRLDVMEETVEKTVEHLETQVKSLLGLLEDLAWNLPPGPFSPAPDLLGDDHF